ncbi:MAG TPA: SGNH/GDSL hydrolase family protein [Streptosporangiaceae bacterium]|nr:SGNH/GDSL hydrolase family protein [Streptosporangiaceae bacterium]
MTTTSEAGLQVAREAPVMRFAALGDSVTLGIGDQMPQGGWRGWAALLAGSLAPPDQVELCNLARSGALIRDVASEQLPLALSVRPALASVLVGVNDTLRGKFDPAAIAADLESTVAALQHAGTMVLTASLPDPGLLLRIPASMRRPLARRAHQINAVLGQLAVRYDLVHVDLAARPEIYDKRMWGVDRLHPSERGHRLLARMFAERLAERGMPRLAPPDPEPANPEPGAWRQAHWMATKGTGWMVRRSRDLLPGLLQLAAKEWWHDRRGGPDLGHELLLLDTGEPG